MLVELVHWEWLHRGLPFLLVPTNRSNLVVRVGETCRREALEWVFSRPWFSKDGGHVKNSYYNKRFRIAFTANVKLYHVTKFSLYLSFTVYYFYTGISCFILCSSSRLIALRTDSKNSQRLIRPPAWLRQTLLPTEGFVCAFTESVSQNIVFFSRIFVGIWETTSVAAGKNVRGSQGSLRKWSESLSH